MTPALYSTTFTIIAYLVERFRSQPIRENANIFVSRVTIQLNLMGYFIIEGTCHDIQLIQGTKLISINVPRLICM